MSEAHNLEQPEIDNPEDDVRAAIESLKIETPPEAKVVIDKSSAVPRDETGKFAPKADEADKARKVLTLPEKPAAANTDIAPGVQAAPAKVDAPKSWTQAERTEWDKLTPAAQAAVMRREDDIVKGLSKQDDERTFGRKVNEIVSPYLPVIRAEGGTPEKAIQDLLQTAHTLRQGSPMQKASMVAGVMRTYGIDPNHLFSILQGGKGGTGSPQQQAPAYNPIIESLEQRLNRVERERQEEVQQRQLQEEQTLHGQIAEFSSKPGHEHFEKVRDVMGILITSGKVPPTTEGLEKAYEMAVYADPEIRDSLIAAKVTAANGQRVADLSAKTSAARNAAGSVTGAPGGTKKLNGSANPSSSIEDDIRAAMREHTGRV
jgi:hypothetical protein